MGASGEACRGSLVIGTRFTRALTVGLNGGVLEQVFAGLQENDTINIQVDHVSLDSTAIKVHPDGTGALKKTVHNLLVSREQDGQQKFTWLQPAQKQP